jgi:hypothetical protein
MLRRFCHCAHDTNVSILLSKDNVPSASNTTVFCTTSLRYGNAYQIFHSDPGFQFVDGDDSGTSAILFRNTRHRVPVIWQFRCDPVRPLEFRQNLPAFARSRKINFYHRDQVAGLVVPRLSSSRVETCLLVLLDLWRPCPPSVSAR